LVGVYCCIGVSAGDIQVAFESVGKAYQLLGHAFNQEEQVCVYFLLQ
jgi:hypothetical protein